ncbi:MAG: NAD-dependent epimerase/dehydratase family protein [Gemmatimonadetes bacterium]|nr:NAD-dependent epimerase/dehydratase family protein [Gemmatimonadota bacterium]
MKDRVVDAVVHLAARVHRADAHASHDPEAYRRDNVKLTVQVAQAALERGIRRFVFVSSIGVFGQSSGTGAFTPETLPHPQSTYAKSKLEAEAALGELARERGLELVIVRPPLVYGAGAPCNLKKLAAAIDKGLPLPLGAVRNRRSLANVEDLAELLRIAARHLAALGRILLPADETPVSTPDLIRAMAAAMGKPARLPHVPVALLKLAGRLTGKAQMIEQLTGNLEVDPTAAMKHLGWRPRYGLRQGMAAFAAACGA